MEIQQHDGVVVEVAVISAGLRQASARGRGVAGGEGGARGCGAAAVPPPTIYRDPWGGGAPALGDQISKGGGGQGGRGVASPPSQVGRPPPLGFPTLGAEGGPRGEHQPTRGWFPSLFSPRGPPG